MVDRLRYVRLPTSNLGAALEFARDVIGLTVSSAGADFARFRSDERSYTLEYDASGATRCATVALEVRSPKELDEIMAGFAARGLPALRLSKEQCAPRQIRDGLVSRDHSGNSIEIVVRPENKGQRPFPSRDSGVTSFSGVALRSTATAQDAALWCEVLGCEIRDYVGESIYLGFDEKHHRVALHPSSTTGLLAMTFDVLDLDYIMQSTYFLSDRRIKILHGPGKEPFSGKIFVSFAGPDGMVFSYSTGISNISDSWRPRQYPHARDSFCGWGSRALIPELADESDLQVNMRTGATRDQLEGDMLRPIGNARSGVSDGLRDEDTGASACGGNPRKGTVFSIG